MVAAVDPQRDGLQARAAAPTTSTLYVEVAGELDLSTLGWFEQLAVSVRERRPDRVVIDGRGISFIDCAGYRALLWFARAVGASGADVVSEPFSPSVTRFVRLIRADVRRDLETSAGAARAVGRRRCG
jgi:anti-anti-sigma factor